MIAAIFMLTIILIGAILPGFAIGLSALIYTMENAIELPGSVSLLLIGMPLFHVAILLRRVKISLGWLDMMFCVFVVMRASSLLQVSWLSSELVVSSALFVATSLGYYWVGRILFMDQRSGERCAFWLSLSFLLLLPLYTMFGSEKLRNGRLVLGEGEAVGLAQPMTIAGACLAAVFICRIVLRNRLELNSSPYFRVLLSNPAILMCIIAAYGLGQLILLNGTRGAMLAIGTAFAFLSLTATRSLKAATIISVIVAAAVAFSVYSAGRQSADPENISGMRLASTWEVVSSSLGLSEGRITDASVSERAAVRSATLSLFWEYPMFGCGYGCVENFNQFYAHNIFLEIAAEGGIISLGVFATIVLITLRNVSTLSASPRNPATLVPCCLFVALFVHFQFSFTLTFGRMLFFSMGAIASMAISQRTSMRKPPSAELRAHRSPKFATLDHAETSTYRP